MAQRSGCCNNSQFEETGTKLMAHYSYTTNCNLKKLLNGEKVVAGRLNNLYACFELLKN